LAAHRARGETVCACGATGRFRTWRGTRCDNCYREHAEQRLAAIRIYEAALQSGELKRPAHCERCGKPGGVGTGRTLDGHHADYGKPLVVEWLCRSCHLSEHGRSDAPQEVYA
jgi:hypothetical protein